MSDRLEKKADTSLGSSVASDIKDRETTDETMPRTVSGTKEEEK